MGIETLKQEDLTEINENELDFFCDSLTSAKKCQYTLGNIFNFCRYKVSLYPGFMMRRTNSLRNVAVYLVLSILLLFIHSVTMGTRISSHCKNTLFDIFSPIISFLFLFPYIHFKKTCTVKILLLFIF